MLSLDISSRTIHSTGRDSFYIPAKPTEKDIADYLSERASEDVSSWHARGEDNYPPVRHTKGIWEWLISQATDPGDKNKDQPSFFSLYSNRILHSPSIIPSNKELWERAFDLGSLLYSPMDNFFPMGDFGKVTVSCVRSSWRIRIDSAGECTCTRNLGNDTSDREMFEHNLRGPGDALALVLGGLAYNDLLLKDAPADEL